jgi:hypothetical protein
VLFIALIALAVVFPRLLWLLLGLAVVLAYAGV